MIPQAVWKPLRSGSAATLALLAYGLLFPSRADASCGDYVMVGGRHVAPHDADLSRQSQAPGAPRCHGPHCSSHSIPPATPAPKVEVTVERWAISGSVDRDLLPNDASWLADLRDVPRDGYGLSILRPPR